MVNVTDGFGSSILGYPRIGPHRELKRALEAYWRGSLEREELLAVGREIQDTQFAELHAAGLTQVPGNTFSFYDHILDNALLFGAVPKRFQPYREDLHPLDFYFLMARGRRTCRRWNWCACSAPTTTTASRSWTPTPSSRCTPRLCSTSGIGPRRPVSSSARSCSARCRCCCCRRPGTSRAKPNSIS